MQRKLECGRAQRGLLVLQCFQILKGLLAWLKLVTKQTKQVITYFSAIFQDRLLNWYVRSVFDTFIFFSVLHHFYF